MSIVFINLMISVVFVHFEKEAVQIIQLRWGLDLFPIILIILDWSIIWEEVQLNIKNWMYLNGNDLKNEKKSWEMRRDEIRELKVYFLAMSFNFVKFPVIYCRLHFISIPFFHLLLLSPICFPFHAVRRTFHFPHRSSFISF